MEFTTHLELHSQATRLFETVPYECCLSCRRVNGVVTLSDPAFQRSYRRPHSGRSSLHYNSDGEARQNDFQFELFPLHSPLLRESLLVSFPPLSYMLKSSGSSYLISGPNLKSFVGEVLPSHTRVCVCAHSPLTRSSAVVHHTFVSCAFHVCASVLPSLGEVLLLLLSQPHTTPGCCSPLHSHTHFSLCGDHAAHAHSRFHGSHSHCFTSRRALQAATPLTRRTGRLNLHAHSPRLSTQPVGDGCYRH